MKTFLLLLTVLTGQAFAGTQTFKMYTEMNVKPNPNCDLHTEMKVTKTGNTATVKLVNKVGGFCEIYADPTPRTFKLTAAASDCGSLVFTNKTAKVTLTDNKTRLCDDMIPALMVLNTPDATYYSHDARSSSPGICTADINQYGNPSACTCEGSTKYDPKSGNCEAN